jgi:hypothetical protein
MHGLPAPSAGRCVLWHDAPLRTALLLLPFLLSSAAIAPADEYRHPPAEGGFAISLAEPDLKPAPGIGTYEIDLFDTVQDTIDALHAAGGYVICYVSAGSFEDWRPDAAQFPQVVLGKDYSGWPGERWLDIRRQDLLAPILWARLDLARKKHCDAVDPDNVDGFSNDTGFAISRNQQAAFNRWIAEAAHARGLAVGLKNAAELVETLAGTFDFAVIENCATDESCGAFRPFADRHKPVFQIEYDITAADWPAICARAKENGFTAILAEEKLDGKARGCPQ